MRSYAARQFVRSELACLRDATNIVDQLDERRVAGGCETLRCHEVARVVGRLLELPVVDGKYGAVEHSWLLTVPERLLGPAGPDQWEKKRPAILDVYAVGRLPQVQLLEPFPLLPHTGAFIPGKERDDIREDVISVLIEPFLADKYCPVHSHRCTPGYSWSEAQYECPWRKKA